MNKLEQFVIENYENKKGISIFSDDEKNAQIFALDILQQLTILLNSSDGVLIISNNERMSKALEFRYHKNIFVLSFNNFYNSEKKYFNHNKFVKLIEILNIKMLYWNVADMEYGEPQRFREYTSNNIDYCVRVYPDSLDDEEFDERMLYILKRKKNKMWFKFLDINTKQLITKSIKINDALTYRSQLH